MSNLLFGYRLLQQDGATEVGAGASMKAATYGSADDQGRLYYLQLYAYRDSEDLGDDIRLEGFDIKLTFNDTILASLNRELNDADGVDTRGDALVLDNAMPLFRTVDFGLPGENNVFADGLNTVRFTAGSSPSISDGAEDSAFPDTGSGYTFAAGDEHVLATVTLDINDQWSTDDNVSPPTPAIESVKVNIDETVVSQGGVVKDIRGLRDLADDAASLVAFDASVDTAVARAAQTLAAVGETADNDAAFAERIGTTRTVGLESSVVSNLVRQGTTFIDYAELYNSGESALTQTQAAKTGFIANGEVTLQIEQRSNSGDAEWATTGSIAHGSSALTLDAINYAVNAAGEVTERGEIRVKRTLVANGDVGTVLTQDGAGGLNIEAYGTGADTKQVIQSIAGTTSKNLITYQGDLNYDGRVSMKDLAFLNAGAAAMAADSADYNAEVDADFDGEFSIGDLAILQTDWGGSLHANDGTGISDANGVDTTRTFGANAATAGGGAQAAQMSWSELTSNSSYTWTDTSFDDQSKVEAGESFVGTALL